MEQDDDAKAAGFGRLFRRFLEEQLDDEEREPPFFADKLREHFGEDPTRLPVVRQELERAYHPDLQLALDAFLDAGRRFELFGIVGHDHRELGIAALLGPSTHGDGPTRGPVEYTNVALANDEVMPCVARGLYLVRENDVALAVLVALSSSYAPRQTVRIEVMSADRERAVRLLAELRTAMRDRSVYRGQVVSLAEDRYDTINVRFHRLRPVAREDIVLPAGVLERVERQTIGFTKQSERLRAAGRHLKRGLLLYGPPGTGKTLTAMYLATQMKERTTFLLTGRGLGLIERSCAMARLLQPATLILEDVDLIAEERTRMGSGCTTILFELLNQMDGLADDADVVFVLTTNRADLLEPALASRPGRIDLAVEIPVPDAEGRRRLIDLYGRGLPLGEIDRARLVQRTEGVSAAFLRELLRKAALISADAGVSTIGDGHLDAALHELAVQGGELLRSLLGARGVAAT